MIILFYVNSPSYFLKLGHKFFQFIHRFRFRFWNVSGLCILPSFFQFIKEIEFWILWKACRLQVQIFFNSLKCLKIGIPEVPLPSYFSNCGDSLSVYTTCDVRQEEPIYYQITSFQEKCLYYNIGNNFLLV